MSQKSYHFMLGRELWNVPDTQADSVIKNVAESEYARNRAERASVDHEIDNTNERIQETEYEVEVEKEQLGCSEEKTKTKLRFGTIFLFIAIPMCLLSAIMIYWSLAASFYGSEHIAFLISLGGGIMVCVGTELLLTAMDKMFSSRELNIYIIITALVMVGCCLGGGMMFAKSRAIQMQVQQYTTTDSVIDDKNNSSDFDVETAKKEIDRLNSRGMILLFIGLEYLAGLCLFQAIRSIKTYSPLVRVVRKRDGLKVHVLDLKKHAARLDSITLESITNDLHAGRNHRLSKGKPAFAVSAALIILSMLLGFFLWSEDAFAEEHVPTNYLISLDVTGSTRRDRHENEKCVLQIIDHLKAGDRIQVLLITEASWSKPEFVIDEEMPSRVGYFNQEIKRAKLRIVRAFRKRIAELPNTRPTSAILDGLFLVSQVLSEQDAERRVLVVLSDMQSNSEALSVSDIAKDPKKSLIKVRDEGLIPDLKGIEVYIMGVSSACMPVKQWRKLVIFWKEFFRLSGCTLRKFGMERHRIN